MSLKLFITCDWNAANQYGKPL
jgi:hypothetical protein